MGHAVISMVTSFIEQRWLLAIMISLIWQEITWALDEDGGVESCSVKPDTENKLINIYPSFYAQDIVANNKNSISSLQNPNTSA